MPETPSGELKESKPASSSPAATPSASGAGSGPRYVSINQQPHHGRNVPLYIGVPILGIMIFGAVHMALRNQFFNERSTTQQHIQRIKNFVHHGEYSTDHALSKKHRDHDACVALGLKYPVQK